MACCDSAADLLPRDTPPPPETCLHPVDSRRLWGVGGGGMAGKVVVVVCRDSGSNSEAVLFARLSAKEFFYNAAGTRSFKMMNRIRNKKRK